MPIDLTKLFCFNQISVKEEDFVSPFLVRCQKHAQHSGMHYAVDQDFLFSYHRLSRDSLKLEGSVQFGWDEDTCYWWGSIMLREGMIRTRQPHFDCRTVGG